MAFTREFIRKSAKESGVEIPKELEDILVQEHLSARDSYTNAKVNEALEANKPEQAPKVEDTEEYKTLKSQFEAYKTEQAEKATKTAKESAAKELLKATGLSGKGLDMALKLYDLGSLELDDNGKAKDFDNLVKTAKAEYAEIIPKGEGYTPPAGNGRTASKDLDTLSMEDYIRERSK